MSKTEEMIASLPQEGSIVVVVGKFADVAVMEELIREARPKLDFQVVPLARFNNPNFNKEGHPSVMDEASIAVVHEEEARRLAAEQAAVKKIEEDLHAEHQRRLKAAQEELNKKPEGEE